LNLLIASIIFLPPCSAPLYRFYYTYTKAIQLIHCLTHIYLFMPLLFNETYTMKCTDSVTGIPVVNEILFAQLGAIVERSMRLANKRLIDAIVNPVPESTASDRDVNQERFKEALRTRYDCTDPSNANVQSVWCSTSILAQLKCVQFTWCLSKTEMLPPYWALTMYGM
jgi:hypothetical protein